MMVRRGCAPAPQVGWISIGDLPDRTGVVGVGEVLRPGQRILVHTVRPARFGADFTTVEAIRRNIPALVAHPELRGDIPPRQAEIDSAARARSRVIREHGERGVALVEQRPDLYDPPYSVWAVFDVVQELPAQRIVEVIWTNGPPDLRFSLSHTPAATAPEQADDLRRAVERVPLVGPLAELARRAAQPSSFVLPIALVFGAVAGGALLVWAVRK